MEIGFFIVGLFLIVSAIVWHLLPLEKKRAFINWPFKWPSSGERFHSEEYLKLWSPSYALTGVLFIILGFLR